MKVKNKILALLCASFTIFSLGMITACDEGESSSNSSSNSSVSSQDSSSIVDTTVYSQPLSGAGEEYNRYECVEGYYKATLTNQPTYYSFSVTQSGRYALYTLNNVSAKIYRYDASSAFLNPYSAVEATLEDGNYYLEVECTDSHYNNEWRATYSIQASGSAGEELKFRFVRIGDATKEPETIRTFVTPTEIQGVAPNKPSGTQATLVPWTKEELNGSPVTYFYDEDAEISVTPIGNPTGTPVTIKGFYRLGTEDNPGEIIWVAITSVPSRLFSIYFADHENMPQNLSLYYGKDDDGNYLIKNYIDFILNNGGQLVDGFPAEGDLTKAVYENVTNSDGLYPVNQELFDFLNLYVASHPPILDEGIVVAEEDKWLAPCYYYATVSEGTKNNPLKITSEHVTQGAVSITVKKFATTYCSMEELTGTYTFTSTDANLVLEYNGFNYGTDGNGFNVTISAEDADLISFKTCDGSAGTFSVCIQAESGNGLTNP